MTARYRIRHTSHYAYDRSVSASFNEARVIPLGTPWQNRLDSSVTIDPSSWHYDYVDYWGTQVRVFEVNTAHRHLDVRATSVVEIDPSLRPGAAELSWPELRDHSVRDALVEYLAQNAATVPPADLADLADSIAADNQPAGAAALISTAVHDALNYRPGVTEVETPAADAWAARSGVCQDYAHLVVGALRHVGMPARYVSGYLYPAVGPQVGESALGESHAWVEWWLGEWMAFDPTNDSDVGERHIMIGTGRAYSDVPPIKGIVAGPHSTTDLTVTVELTRLA